MYANYSCTKLQKKCFEKVWSTLREHFVRDTSQEIFQCTKNRESSTLEMIMKYFQRTKIKYCSICSMSYISVDQIFFNWLFRCNKEKTSGSVFKFWSKESKTFQGTGITDLMLHILSCVKMLNNTCGSMLRTCNDDLVQSC